MNQLYWMPVGFVVADVETTGLNPAACSLLSIGAVHPHSGDEFYAECQARDGALIQADALRVNGCSMERVHDERLPTPEEIVSQFVTWCQCRMIKQMGGMNPRFDLDFMRAEWCRNGERHFPLSHRTVDMHSLAWARALHLGFNAETMSRLATDSIYALLSLPPEPQPHNALTGARREAEAFAILLGGGQ